MSIEVENNNAIVTVKGPMRYQAYFQMPAISMATVYPHMIYCLSINNTYRNKTVSILHKSGQAVMFASKPDLVRPLCFGVFKEPFHIIVWSVQAPPDRIQHRVLLLC